MTKKKWRKIGLIVKMKKYNPHRYECLSRHTSAIFTTEITHVQIPMHCCCCHGLHRGRTGQGNKILAQHTSPCETQEVILTLKIQGISFRFAWMTSEAKTELTENSSSLMETINRIGKELMSKICLFGFDFFNSLV